MKTVRRRGGLPFVGLRASLTRAELDAYAQRLADAHVQWEAQPLTLHDGTWIANGYVLWLPELYLTQLAAGGFALGEPPQAPDPDQAGWHADTREQLDREPARVAEAPARPRRRRTGAPARAKTTKYKGVTRIDREAGRQPDGRRITATHGYMVRVFWQKQRYQAFFSDLKYGDRLAALDAAVAWRDRTEERVGNPRTDRTVIGYANSNTGEMGITRRTVRGHDVFEVTWRDPIGKTRRTRYSIDKNGEKRALQKAKKARRLGELRRVQEPRDR